MLSVHQGQTKWIAIPSIQPHRAVRCKVGLRKRVQEPLITSATEASSISQSSANLT
jgi:hypothetical protein